LINRLYANWISGWETRLANEDTNRVVRPFEWGLEWLGVESPDQLLEFVRASEIGSDQFFASEGAHGFKLRGSTLEFTSGVQSPYPENNLVRAEYFPAAKHNGRVVLVIPQWNADVGGHIGLCKLLNRFGISALRLSMAYHHARRPAETVRAEYHVSSNIGRTIHATRQSVVDARSCLDWLASQGYGRIGLVGTSLGSCVALLAAAHDPRVRAAAFNHVSLHFADPVYTGMSCRHIQASVCEVVTQEQLRQLWRVISPAPYVAKLAETGLHSLLIWGRYDSTFRPEYSKLVVDEFRRLGLPHEEMQLACGHYTTAKFPFQLMDGFRMAGFLKKHL